jgi:hypothetical protein
MEFERPMKAVVYRPIHPDKTASWRPRSLVDMRGPVFPDEYCAYLLLEATDIHDAMRQYSSKLGDVVFLGEGDEMLAHVAGPYNWELVKFGTEWRSPPLDDSQTRDLR